MWALLVLAIAVCCASCTRDAGAKGSDKKMLEYDEAVKLLAGPDTWCKGAARLAKLGDVAALAPLARAWRQPAEAEKICLSDAMAALGGDKEAARLYASKVEDEHAAGLVLMLLFGNDSHLPTLERGASDPATLRVLVQQKRSEKWEQTMIRLLESGDVVVRGQAAEELAGRKGEAVAAGLRARLGKETDAGVKAKIEAALKK
ncbi:MAG: HEAT repeat domain-containing protein [Kofleriaceae bacterium]